MPQVVSLQDNVELQELVLRYLRCALLVFVLEDVLSFLFGVYRLVQVCKLTGLTLGTWNQITMTLQFAVSLIMIGFNMNGLREKLRLHGLQIKQEAKLATVVAKATTEMDGFDGVSGEEVDTMLRARHTLNETKVLEDKPRDVGGDVMLLRRVRAVRTKGNKSADPVIEVVAMMHDGLTHREELAANQVRTRILKDNLAFHTVPDSTELQMAFPNNMHLCRSVRGHLVQFEAWGSADVSRLKEHWGGERFMTTSLFLHELLNMHLVELSHRERKVLGVLLLVDAGGMTTQHAELLPFLNKARKLRSSIYPCMVAEVIVVNSSFSRGATRRALKALQLPAGAVQFDEDLNLVSTHRISAGSSSTRVAPTSASRAVSSPEAWLEAILDESGTDDINEWCNEFRLKELSLHTNQDAEAWTPLRTGLDGIEGEWCKNKGSSIRVYRFLTKLEGVNARDAFNACWESIGTSEYFGYGDRSVSFNICGLALSRVLEPH